MSDGFPSMTALLGLLAIAGYQNRDKISEMLGGKTQAMPAPSGPAPAPSPGGLGGLLGNLGGTSAGGFLGGGLSDLVNHFQQNGQGPVAQSWVNHGANQEIAPNQLEQALGPDMINALTQKTGLSRADLLTRLSKTLPHAVDQYTPDGKLPAY